MSKRKDPADPPEPFWRRKSFSEMNDEEWESLCDGCGRCCLNKMEYEDTGEIIYTNVACRLLNDKTCRCRRYAKRATLVEDCITLSRDDPEQFRWLPATCAYRRLAEGKALESWHPLVSGDPATVHVAGISVREKVVNERYIHPDQLEEHIVDWIK